MPTQLREVRTLLFVGRLQISHDANDLLTQICYRSPEIEVRFGVLLQGEHYMRPQRLALLFSMLLATDVFAQALPSTGADAWISQMRRQDLFQAHLNDCDTSTEAFISVGATNRGFCIEKAERTAASWLDARETCLAAEKRLPEPAEFQSACNQAATLSLSNMTDDWEWASNFARDFAFESTYRYGVGTPRMGNPGCNRGSIGWIATTDAVVDTLPYRCVR